MAAGRGQWGGQDRSGKMKDYFEGYEGGYTNQSGSANDVGGKRRLTDSDMDDTKKAKTGGMDLSTLVEMVQFNQQNFAAVNDSDLPEAEKEEKLKKVIQRQSMLLEMQAEMIKTQAEASEDDPMDGVGDDNRRGGGSMNRGGPMGGMNRGGPMGGMNRGGPMGGMNRGGPMGGMNRGGVLGGMNRGGPMGGMNIGHMRGMFRDSPMGRFDRGPPMGHFDRGGPMGPGFGNMEMDYFHGRRGGMMGGPRGGMRPMGPGFFGNPGMGFMNYDDGPPPPQPITIEEKLVFFKDLLLEKFDPSLTCYQMIENCRKSIDDTEMKIRTDYRFERDYDKLPVEISGRLKLMGVFIAKGEGTNESLLKEEVYRKALYILHTKCISEILQLSNEECERIGTETNTKPKRSFVVNNYGKLKLSLLNKKLPRTENQKDAVRDLDFICSMNNITVTAVLYKGETDDKLIVCEVYVDDCFMGTGEDNVRKESIKKAYIDCKRTLRINQIDDIVAETKKLTKLNHNDPKILDILNKGRFYEIGSNIGGLMLRKSIGRETYHQDVVVMIKTGEQEPEPFKILENCATGNGLFLEYVLHCPDKCKESKDFRCLMYLNGKLVSCSIGQNKPQAKFSASECSVQELTCRYTLVEYTTRRYYATTSNDDLVDMAMTLKQSGRDITQEVPQELVIPESVDELDPYLYRVLENMILEYSSIETLEELIFGPDLPDMVVEQLVKKCMEWNVDGSRRTNGAQTYVVVNKFKQYTGTDICDFLLGQPNFNCGRYTLIHLRQPKGKLQYINDCSSDIKRYLKTTDDEEDHSIPEDLGLFV